MSYPVAVKYLRLLVFIITGQRSIMNEVIDPPGKNRPQAFYKHHSELKSKNVKVIDWNCHNNNIYNKITHWFGVIRKELQDSVIVSENV